MSENRKKHLTQYIEIKNPEAQIFFAYSLYYYYCFRPLYRIRDSFCNLVFVKMRAFQLVPVNQETISVCGLWALMLHIM